MFLEFFDLLVRGDKQELFKRCFNRCYAAAQVSYEYDKTKASHLWSVDERYREQSIEILYERFSYAMAMVADRFHSDCRELGNLSDAQKKSISFATFLSGAVDEVFKRTIKTLGFADATMEYYEWDYFDDEEYDKFWDREQPLKAATLSVRNGFYKEERTFLHGFSESDRDDFETYNRDCLHIMRIYKRWGDVDVEKFLTASKREYLPMMIKLFIARPKEDVFADKSKWWQFWKK